MLNENKSLLKLKLKKEKSNLTKLYKKVIESLYELFDLILDDPVENFWFELISLFICYIQIIMFIFNETVSKLILNENLINSFYLFGIKSQ